MKTKISIKDIPTLWDEQRMALVRAIERYLSWRDDKQYPDFRGFPVTVFTWLRHYTDFGKNRALTLKRALSQATDPMHLLQAHFQQDSKLNNHSLDTYLLEGITNNRSIFLIPDSVLTTYPRLTSDNRESFRNYLMQLPLRSEVESTYLVACGYYQSHHLSQKNQAQYMWQCFEFCLIQNYEPAITFLQKLSLAPAYFLLAKYVHYPKPDYTSTLSECLKAVDLGYESAEAFLETSFFSAKYALQIAYYYQKKANLEKARLFFHKASSLKEAAFELGLLYEQGISGKKELESAFGYFQMAAEKRQDQALEKMNTIANQLNTPDLWLAFANTCLLVLEDPYPGLAILKNTAEQSYKPAENALTKAAFSNHKNAFILGQLYDQDNAPETRIKKAAFYYLLALESPKITLEDKEKIQEKLSDLLFDYTICAEEWLWIGHLYALPHQGFQQDWTKAKHYIEIAARQDSMVALYQLGQLYEYGHGVEKDLIAALQYYELSKTNPDSAIKWAQITKSNKTPNEVLAKLIQLCETGDPVFKKDQQRALELHHQFSQRGFTQASLYLGQFFQVQHETMPKDENRAFEYYLKAASLGDTNALPPLERLAENQSAANQHQLSRVFLKVFKDREKYDYWESKAELLEHCLFNF